MARPPNRERPPIKPTKTDVSKADKVPPWYRLPRDVRLIIYEYLLLSYPTGVRAPHFRITRSVTGPRLASLDIWKYIKDDITPGILYSHIFLGTYSQKRGIYHHHPGDRHPNDAKLPVDKCLPRLEMNEKVRKVSARYNQRFDPSNAMSDIFGYVSALKTAFRKLENVEFIIVIQKWCLWLPMLQHGLVEDVENWIRSLEEETPEGLTIFLELGNRTPTNVNEWNSAGRELFENFDREIVNKALRRIVKVSGWTTDGK